MIAPRTLEIGFEVIKNKFVMEAEAPQLRKDLPDFSADNNIARLSCALQPRGFSQRTFFPDSSIKLWAIDLEIPFS